MSFRRAAPSPCACNKRWASDVRWLRVCTLEGNVITSSLNPLSYLSVHSSEQGKLELMPWQAWEANPRIFHWGGVYFITSDGNQGCSWADTGVRRGAELLTGASGRPPPLPTALLSLPSHLCLWFPSPPPQSSTESTSFSLIFKHFIDK